MSPCYCGINTAHWEIWRSQSGNGQFCFVIHKYELTTDTPCYPRVAILFTSHGQTGFFSWKVIKSELFSVMFCLLTNKPIRIGKSRERGNWLVCSRQVYTHVARHKRVMTVIWDMTQASGGWLWQWYVCLTVPLCSALVWAGPQCTASWCEASSPTADHNMYTSTVIKVNIEHLAWNKIKNSKIFLLFSDNKRVFSGFTFYNLFFSTC